MDNKLIVIEAPNEAYSAENENSIKVFIAGGITNCPNWQKELIEYLQVEFKEVDYYIPTVSLYNPRRENFPIDIPEEMERQIVWEYHHLKEADIIIYWFSNGSLNPIVLYELGKWGNSGTKEIIMGIDPLYERKDDVIIQTKLAKPELEVCEDFGIFKANVFEKLASSKYKASQELYEFSKNIGMEFDERI